MGLDFTTRVPETSQRTNGVDFANIRKRKLEYNAEPELEGVSSSPDVKPSTPYLRSLRFTVKQKWNNLS